MRERFSLSIFVCVFGIILFLPWAQWAFNIFPRAGLNNVKIPKEMPSLSWESFSSSKFQQELESFALRKSGFWGALVRTDNQINYSLFHQVSSGYSSTVLYGEDGTLFEKAYVDSWNGRGMLSDEELIELANKLKTLQQLLAERNIAMLFLISPSKAEFEPEKIPSNLVLGINQRHLSNRERLTPMLDQKGIEYINSPKILSQLRKQTGLPIFSKCGTHWLSYASCYATADLANRIGMLIGKNVPNFSCGPDYRMRRTPMGTDRDLVVMLNLWNAAQSCEPVPVMDVKKTSVSQAYKPKVLFVGTSFLFQVMDILDRVKFYQERQMYFYFRKNYSFALNQDGKAAKRRLPIDRKALDWEQSVFSNDVIVLEVNEGSIPILGHGFIEAAIERLKSKAS